MCWWYFQRHLQNNFLLRNQSFTSICCHIRRFSFYLNCLDMNFNWLQNSFYWTFNLGPHNFIGYIFQSKMESKTWHWWNGFRLLHCSVLWSVRTIWCMCCTLFSSISVDCTCWSSLISDCNCCSAFILICTCCSISVFSYCSVFISVCTWWCISEQSQHLTQVQW